MKTLRELEKTQPIYDESYNIIGVERLRQEVIRWINFCRGPPVKLEEWSVKSLLDFWMERFDITKEDLSQSDIKEKVNNNEGKK